MRKEVKFLEILPKFHLLKYNVTQNLYSTYFCFTFVSDNTVKFLYLHYNFI